MDGPSHYREAENCLALVSGADESAVVPTLDECQTMIAIAQVHATLALAADSPAAKVLTAAQELLDVLDRHGWNTPTDVDDARYALRRAMIGVS